VQLQEDEVKPDKSKLKELQPLDALMGHIWSDLGAVKTLNKTHKVSCVFVRDCMPQHI